MNWKRSPATVNPYVAATVIICSTFGLSPAYAESQITLIQTGDFHGHLAPRHNLRSNAAYPNQIVGGLARIKTKIQQIQKEKGGVGNTLVLHTGDTIQGSGEALYTRGQAVVDVVDMLGIDAYAPGNWDFVYGPDRFQELFATDLNPHLPSLPEQAEGRTVHAPFGTRWGGLAANLYLSSKNPSAPKDPTAVDTQQDSNVSQTEYDNFAQWYAGDQPNGKPNAQRVLPPYAVRYVNGVKIGLIGCTTSRGPQVVGKWVTEGFEFTDCSNEVKKFAKKLRLLEQVDLLLLLSEIEIGRNIQIIKSLGADEHIDIVLNSDMHEEAAQPIAVTDSAGNKTWIIEAGQDGTLMNEITLTVRGGSVTGMNYLAHRIDDQIPENPAVAAKIAAVRAPYNDNFDATVSCNANSPYWNSFTQETCLNGPLNAVVGHTDVALHRNNYSHESMPAVIEGSSHDFLADAIRWWAKSDIATVRGFRYGTHIAANGSITRNDLFHYVPIGPRVGKVSRVTLNQIRNQIDNSSLAVFSTSPNSAVTPRPAYNNATYASYTLIDPLNLPSPGAGLPKGGLAGTTMGWGGGWLFAYSGDGFHMNFDPYYTPTWQTVYAGNATSTSASGVYLGNNTQITRPAADTSRVRSLTVKMPCKNLPPAEQYALGGVAGCNAVDSNARFTTVMTTASDGKYATNWVTNYGTGVNAVLGAAAKDTYLLNPDGWRFLKGTPNNPNGDKAVRAPFQAPTFTVAGYWYKQSPNSINNCNNCFPTGWNTTVGDPDAAYLLPVNEDGNGNPALDADGNPIYVRDGSGNVVMEDGKPKVEGKPIDLTVIVEKYLASLENQTVTSDNLQLNRIGLINPLPDFTATLGFPIMQPLCGTIGRTAASATICP